MISSIVKAVANIVAYLFSERRMKAKDQAERDRIASEVAEGDEDAVNARLGRLRVFPWILFAVLSIGGCWSRPKPVYVREADKVLALAPGRVHTNTTDVVEWIVPRTRMSEFLLLSEGLNSK